MKQQRGKQQRGLGRIFKRADSDRWWIEVWHRGRQYRESSRSTSEDDALALLRKRHGEIARDGRLVGRAAERLVYEDLEEMLVADHVARSLRSTVNAEHRLQHVRGFFEGVRALDISFDLVNVFVARRRKQKAAAATIRYEVALLGRMLRLAHRAGKLLAVPALPSVALGDNARKGFCSPEEIDRVITHLPDHARPVVRALYLTGWRSREILGLEWRCVDFEAGELHLERGRSKSGKPRTFPFRALPALAELLEQQRERTSALERRAGRIVPWVFWRGAGKPVGSIRTAWRTAVKKAGLPALVPHDLRRSAARNLVRAGVPESVVMKLCGWTTRHMLDRYNVTAGQDLVDGVAKLGVFLGGSSRTVSRTFSGSEGGSST